VTLASHQIPESSSPKSNRKTSLKNLLISFLLLSISVFYNPYFRLQAKSFRKSKYNFMPKENYFVAQDLLACHFGSFRGRPAILAVSLAIAHLASR
jgi:hypothetical protein